MTDDFEQETTLGTYYVREGREQEFEQAIPQSWDVLRRLGFITEQLPILFRSTATPHVYIELAQWRPHVMGPAHEHPDVIPIWARLADLVEARAREAAPRGLTFAEFVQVHLHA